MIPNHQEYTGTDLAIVADGQAILITHIGNSQLKASSHIFHLRKVLRVPSMTSNLCLLINYVVIMIATFILMHIN